MPSLRALLASRQLVCLAADRSRLVTDVDGTRGLMAAEMATPIGAGVEVPAGVTASIEMWRSWGERLQSWAEEE